MIVVIQEAFKSYGKVYQYKLNVDGEDCRYTTFNIGATGIYTRIYYDDRMVTIPYFLPLDEANPAATIKKFQQLLMLQ